MRFFFFATHSPAMSPDISERSCIVKPSNFSLLIFVNLKSGIDVEPLVLERHSFSGGADDVPSLFFSASLTSFCSSAPSTKPSEPTSLWIRVSEVNGISLMSASETI